MIVNYSTIASKTALDMIQAAIAQASAMDLSVAVAIVDLSGHVLASARMDGVAPPTLTFAEDKAYTSATMKRSTQAFAERMASSPSLSLGFSTRSRLLVWGGGLPIYRDGKIVGGIGVSGAKDVEDIEIGQNVLQQFGFSCDA